MTGTVCRLPRAAALGCLMLLAVGLASPGLFAQQRVGINSAVNPNAMGIPPGGLPRRLVLGQDVVFNERITTEASGQTQVLFVDESTLSIGPNANMVIDQFVYDPNAGTGKLAASLSRGVFRFVGGKISKLDNAVTLQAPSATIGIRGGVMLIRVRNDCGSGGCNALQVVFVYGKGVTITGLNGVTRTIYRPGFEVTVAKPGAAPSDPSPAPPSATTEMLAQLDGRAGSNGGAPKVPTEVTVANSGIANVISANVQASLQAAAKTQPLQSQPENVTPVITQAQLNNQNVQVSGATATSVNGGTVAFNQFLANPAAQGTQIPSTTTPTAPVRGGSGSIVGSGGSMGGTGASTSTRSNTSSTGTRGSTGSSTGSTGTSGSTGSSTRSTGTGGSTGSTGTSGATGSSGGTGTGGATGSSTGTGSMSSAPPPPPSPVVVSVAGLAKVTTDPPTTAGFNLQTPGYRVPYTSGTITYPSGSVLQNGIFSTIISGEQVTVAPLTPGSTTPVTATTSNGATATGSATTTADGKFFYANLTSTTPGSQGTGLFIFGGVPVDQSFYAGNLPGQVTAFQVRPDGALAAGSQAQTIPFLPSNYGGTMPNATVSPLYLATIANQSFGNFNATTNPNGAAPHYLQASLAVNGQGANQSSAFVVTTGGFDTSNTGQVYGAGPVRGVVFTSATAPLVRIGSASATVPDGNGNNLFGGNALSGSVLDQNEYNNGSFSLNLANAFPDSPAGYASGGTNYAFNQPVTATPLPSNVGVTRSQLNETGYFGGIMQLGGQLGAPTFYVLTGDTTVQTFPSDNRVAAAFIGTDPFTQRQSRLSSMVLQFGSNTTGLSYSRSTFIDNNIYAATENPNIASQIATTNGAATTLPTYASGSTLYPRLAMVTSATVPNTSWMPAGVTPCSCEYLQWGYWTGQVGIPNPPGTSPSYSRLDSGAINTWIAGMPTVNMPTSGMGSYNGAAVGTVYNDGATYLAAGKFNQQYNFSAHTGTISITNFDNANYVASLVGSGSAFAGPLTGPLNRNGAVVGNFYGPSAKETGGSFNVFNGQTAPALKYLASGIFAGR